VTQSQKLSTDSEGSEMKSVPPAAGGSRRGKSKSQTSKQTSSGVKVIKKARDPKIIEAEIAEVERKLATLSEEMSKPEVARDITQLVKVNDDYQLSETRLNELLEEWERAAV
jgi:hypothetical protein